MRTRIGSIIIGLTILGLLFSPSPAATAPSTYYVSSASGSDSNNGLSEGTPFASIAKVNALNLQPGDRVLFKCGDTWRAEQLILSKSGTEAASIQFSSYPAGCANKPILSGSRPIGGWTVDSGSVYFATLSPTDFPLGINQLFRGGQRLTLGRWPNLDAANAGYSFVDAHTTNGSQISDNELPANNWNDAIVHIKNIRWSMLDRQVTGTSGKTLTLNTGSVVPDFWSDQLHRVGLTSLTITAPRSTRTASGITTAAPGAFTSFRAAACRPISRGRWCKRKAATSVTAGSC